MDRRKMVMTSVLAAGAGALMGKTAAAETEKRESGSIQRVVYHLSDTDKVHFVLANMKNHLAGMGGPDHVSIAVVIHGPPLAAFRTDSKDLAVAENTEMLMENRVAFFACINTMNAMKIGLPDLVPGFGVADKGGVVKLAELQGQGWLYLRP
jgi:intracellular sulfur oxidation DsrE/DsrF family protein